MNKRILSLGLISAVAFGLVSCEKVEFQQESSTIGDNFGFIAEISEESRTTNNNSYTTAWLNDDEMEVFYYSSNTKQYTFKYNNGIFTPISSEGISENEKTWVGVYPKTNSVTFKSSFNSTTTSVVLTVPDTFTQVGNNSMSHLAGVDGLPMYGSVTGKLSDEPKMKMSMKQMAAVIKFNITNAYEKAVTISRIEFEAADDNLVGQFTGTLSSDAVSSWSAGTGAAKKVTLNVQDGSSVASGSSAAFYVGTAPFSHGSGHNYTLTVYGTDSEGQELKATKTVSLTMTLASAKVKTINYTFPADATPIVKKTYTKVSENSGTLEAGTYLIVNNKNERALSGTTDDNTNNYIAVSLSEDDVITGDYSENEMTISVSGSNYTIQNASGDYLFADEDNSNTYIGYHSGANNFTLEKSSSYVDRFYFKTSRGTNTSEYLYYNSGGYFKIGGSGVPGRTDSGVYLYKYVDPRTPQILSFSGADDAQIDLANENKTFKATLKGANTDVTYTSSDESVATVASDGTVTAVAKGATVITATAAGNNSYQAGSASYTLTVINSLSTDVVLDRATSVESGKSYVMVNNGKALQNNNGSFGAVRVQEASNHSSVTIDSDIDISGLVWTWTSSTINEDYGAYTVSNESEYLIMTKVTSGMKTTYTLNINAIPTGDAAKYAVWFYKNSEYVMNSKDRYLQYDDGWSVKAGSTSADENCSTYLYEYVDPRTPQTLSFDDESPEVDINDWNSYTQTVKGTYYTDVIYSITSASPSDAATINSSTGELTLKKRGTIVVTATAAGTDHYRPAEAFYTLVVKDRNAKKTYSKVTVKPNPLDWSGTYLIVDETAKVAFAYDQSSNGYKTSVSISDNKIVSSELEKYEVTISAIASDKTHYDINTSAGDYLYYTGSGSILHESNKSGSTYYAKIGEESMISLGTKQSNGTEYFFSYNSSNSAFEFSETQNTIQLYKLDSSE